MRRCVTLKPLHITPDEPQTLEAWLRRPTTAHALAERARIVLAASRGQSNTAVAQRLGIYRMTVSKWRGRFLSKRIAGLLDEPRPRRPAPDWGRGGGAGAGADLGNTAR